MTCVTCPPKPDCANCPILHEGVSTLRRLGDVPHERFVELAILSVKENKMSARAASKLYGVGRQTIANGLK
jgi:hypothetical protein